jgi:hypothetical protein
MTISTLPLSRLESKKEGVDNCCWLNSRVVCKTKTEPALHMFICLFFFIISYLLGCIFRTGVGRQTVSANLLPERRESCGNSINCWSLGTDMDQNGMSTCHGWSQVTLCIGRVVDGRQSATNAETKKFRDQKYYMTWNWKDIWQRVSQIDQVTIGLSHVTGLTNL